MSFHHASEKSVPFLHTQESFVQENNELSESFISLGRNDSFRHSLHPIPSSPSNAHRLNTAPYTTTDEDYQLPAIRNAEKIKKYLSKLYKATLGNRRLRIFLYRLLKIITITYIQANNVLGSADTSAVRLVLKIISYIFMALLCFITLARYVRELTAVAKKKPLSIWLNWMEALLFCLYLVYSILTAVFHIMFAVSWYEVEKVKTNHEISLNQQLSVFVMFVLLYVYNALEIGSHYIHSGHSVSIFLTQAKPIPRRETKIILNETNSNGIGTANHPFLQSIDLKDARRFTEEKYLFNNRADRSRSRYFAEEDNEEEEEDNYIPTAIRNQQLWRHQLNLGTISTLASTL
ncbi:hypothetical protein FDP41_012605 [Naegleria fowleri]|uniref:Uncharacterized protein n=1 Tax=Naegleria fowleri TaxID=5763 RepID=A0A6A5C773_NAEFO|nr:uncharacterized protein FDP41_012605 [Naegleria fowleri]KAF0981345.1 hypothetical protein FDP41_012605 [Naegleria fowleri]CAG4709706.1 unnamed protein product [Naegleria fowleri]